MKANQIHFGRQVLVWRDEDDFNTNNFAYTIFWDVLMPKFHAMIADTLQTTYGRTFWRNRLAEAINEKHKLCYF
jgi:hypothetical protein